MKYDIDFSELDALLDVSEDEKIANLIYPIYKIIKDSVQELDDCFKNNLLNEVASAMLLMNQRINDLLNILGMLLQLNHKNTVELNGETIDIEKHTELINDIINKYNSKELAELYYENLKLTYQDKADDELEKEFAAIDALFEE